MNLLMIMMGLATIIGMVKILRWAFKAMTDLAAIGFSLVILYIVSNIWVTIVFGPLWLALAISSTIIFAVIVTAGKPKSSI